MRGGREGKGGRGQRKVFGGGEFGGEKGRGASTPHRDHAACAVLRGRPKHPLACARRLGGALDARRRVRLVLHRSAARTLLVACVDADGGDCVEALASVVPRRAVPPRTSAPQRRRHVAVPLNLLPQPRRLRPLRRRVGHVPRRQQRALGVLPRPLRVEVQRALPRRRQHTLLAEVARQVQPLVPLRLALAVRRRRRAVLRRARRRVHLVEHADVYGAARQVPAARPRRRLLHADDRPAQLDARRQARLVGAPPRAPPAAAVRAAAARRHIVVLVRRAHAVPARAARTRLLRPLQAAAADGRLAAQDADAGRLRERVGPRLLREVAPRTHAVRRRRGAAAATSSAAVRSRSSAAALMSFRLSTWCTVPLPLRKRFTEAVAGTGPLATASFQAGRRPPFIRVFGPGPSCGIGAPSMRWRRGVVMPAAEGARDSFRTPPICVGFLFRLCGSMKYRYC
eukprot:Rhum_TRINITY_DN14689_c10_g1::Rhum_TRINITY_DN14689_c10_g1_i1::g.109836::m.109836